MTKVIKYYIPLLNNQKNSDELCQSLKEIDGVVAIDTDLQQQEMLNYLQESCRAG